MRQYENFRKYSPEKKMLDAIIMGLGLVSLCALAGASFNFPTSSRESGKTEEKIYAEDLAKKEVGIYEQWNEMIKNPTEERK